MQNRITRPRTFWEDTFKAWEVSGQTITAWCQEKNLSYNTFCKWRVRLSKPSLIKTSFLEIKEEKSSSLKLEYHGIHIHLDQNFDPQTLKKCLQALQGFKC